MHTKEKILAAALQLYNNNGMGITTRHIAAELSISPGNLHYHFKHTDDIIKELYNQLTAEYDQLILQLNKTKQIDTVFFDEIFKQSFKIIHKYRFVFLYFVEIGKRIPAIKNSYQKLIKKRTKEFNTIFTKLIETGFLRNDIPDDIWAALVTQVFIVADFWLSNNELNKGLSGSKAAKEYAKLMQAMLYPYLAKQ